MGAVSTVVGLECEWSNLSQFMKCSEHAKSYRIDSEWLSKMKWPEEKFSGHFDFYPRPDTVWN